jgi:hypothetical protein
MQVFGHRNIKKTIVYSHLVNLQGDKFTRNVANSIDDAGTLVENEFNQVTDMDGRSCSEKNERTDFAHWREPLENVT